MDSLKFPTFVSTNAARSAAITELKMSVPLIWKIKNVNHQAWKMLTGRGKIKGPDFKFHPHSEEVWQLEIDTNIRWLSEKPGYSLNLKKVSEGKSSLKEFTVSWVVQRDDKQNKLLKKKWRLLAEQHEAVLFDHTTNNFIKFIFGEHHLCNMVVQIEIDDTYAQDSVNRDVKPFEYRSLLEEAKLDVLADMESVLKDAKFTDIALRSEGKEIRAHRAILAGRSPVFKGMFQHQMRENASGLVDIPDVPHDILQLLVTFMYSGRLVDLDDKSASELFVVSDKYEVKLLHDTCALFLKGNMTAENCLQIIMLADQHCNEDLKSFAVLYFSEHSSDICKIPDWENVIAARPHVLLELLKVLAEKS